MKQIKNLHILRKTNLAEYKRKAKEVYGNRNRIHLFYRLLMKLMHKMDKIWRDPSLSRDFMTYQ